MIVTAVLAGTLVTPPLGTHLATVLQATAATCPVSDGIAAIRPSIIRTD